MLTSGGRRLRPLKFFFHSVSAPHRAHTQGGARNTESFDPKSTLVRPDMRVIIGPNRETFGGPGEDGPRARRIAHDDVVIVPEFFCKEDDWAIYYALIEEMRAAQADRRPKAQWKAWAEGAHLITDDPTHSKTYRMIQENISKYFGIDNEEVGTRFNWYTDRCGSCDTGRRDLDARDAPLQQPSMLSDLVFTEDTNPPHSHTTQTSVQPDILQAKFLRTK